jgi:hypothetical protein
VAVRDSVFKSWQGATLGASPTPKWAPGGAQHTAKKENQPSLEDTVPHRTEGCGGIRNRLTDGCKEDVRADEADAKEAQALAQPALSSPWPATNAVLQRKKKPLNQPYGIVSHRTEVCRGEQHGRVKRCHCLAGCLRWKSIRISRRFRVAGPSAPTCRSSVLPNLMPAPDVSGSSASRLKQ